LRNKLTELNYFLLNEEKENAKTGGACVGGGGGPQENDDAVLEMHGKRDGALEFFA
jgi:hypothetical protein